MNPRITYARQVQTERFNKLRDAINQFNNLTIFLKLPIPSWNYLGENILIKRNVNRNKYLISHNFTRFDEGLYLKRIENVLILEMVVVFVSTKKIL